jgi:hypothetical protein
MQRQIQIEKRAFYRFAKMIPLDPLGRHVCEKIDYYFRNDTEHPRQVLWMYHNANRMFRKTLELSKYPWKSRERTIRAREVEALKGFMLKDLIQWQKSG